MEEHPVVTCFLRHGTEVLLVRRSDAVGSYRGRWGGVSGYAEGAPEEAARWEVDEEVGLLDACELVRWAEPLPVEDADLDTRWLVHPFLFDCARTDVDTNEEIADHEWVQPPAIFDRRTVPRLWPAYAAVAPTVDSVAGDTDHGSAYISVRALEVLRDAAAAAATATDAAQGTETILETAAALRAARPSMAVVRNRIDRVLAATDRDPSSVLDRASSACERAVSVDSEAAVRAVDHLGERVMTLSRSGTVTEALRTADPETVYVAESRPACEGVEVAHELADAGLDVTLHVDAAVAHVIETEDVDTVLVGADTVLPDGTVVNKVGTHTAALAATEDGIDCYAVCARDKVVPETAVDLEEGPLEAVHEDPAGFDVLNPTFEPTPARHVTGIITEDGLLSPDDVAAVAAEHAEIAERAEAFLEED